MKGISTILIFLLFVFFFSIGCKQTTAQQEHFHVTFEQDDMPIEAIGGKVTLEKKKFSIVFDLLGADGILIHASHNPKTYEMAKNGTPLSEMSSFAPGKAMAEYDKNPKKQIILAEDAYSYWYYKDKDKHRFDKITSIENGVRCKRIIRNLRKVAQDEPIKVRDVQRDLYLVFIYHTWEEKFVQNEMKREFVQIEWE